MLTDIAELCKERIRIIEEKMNKQFACWKKKKKNVFRFAKNLINKASVGSEKETMFHAVKEINGTCKLV